MISFKYNTGMKIAGQKFQKEERHVLLKDSMDTVFFIRNLSQNVGGRALRGRKSKPTSR